MKRVSCSDDGIEYFFKATNAFDAIEKMLYTLNLKHEDKNATITCSRATVSLLHNGKTYRCIIK